MLPSMHDFLFIKFVCYMIIYSFHNFFDSFRILVSVWGVYSSGKTMCAHGPGHVGLWGYGTENPIVVHFLRHHYPALLITRYLTENQGVFKNYFVLNYFNSFKPYLYVFIVCIPVLLVNFVSFPFFQVPQMFQVSYIYILHVCNIYIVTSYANSVILGSVHK